MTANRTERDGGDLQPLDVVHRPDAQARLRREREALGEELGVKGGHEGDLSLGLFWLGFGGGGMRDYVCERCVCVWVHATRLLRHSKISHTHTHSPKGTMKNTDTSTYACLGGVDVGKQELVAAPARVHDGGAVRGREDAGGAVRAVVGIFVVVDLSCIVCLICLIRYTYKPTHIQSTPQFFFLPEWCQGHGLRAQRDALTGPKGREGRGTGGVGGGGGGGGWHLFVWALFVCV